MDKPAPNQTKETTHYWEGCAAHELRYQYCEICDRAQFPPAERCKSCHQSEIVWRQSGLKGTLHSFSLVHRAPTQAFIADTPYYIGLIDLIEGFRIMTNVQVSDGQEVEIGAPIEVFFEKRGDSVVLPQAIIATSVDD